MNNNELAYIVDKNPLIIQLQELLLILFIILSPVYKCFEEFTIAGVNPISLLIGAVLLCYVVNLLHIVNSGQQRFFSLTVFTVFFVELLLDEGNSNVGWTLTVLLYIAFLQTDERISIKKIYKAFLISSIVAACFSVSVGLSEGVMTRAATMVDGSIAPIAITIILFCDTESKGERTAGHDILQVLSMVASMIVLVFGMSRARFLIVAVCLIIYAVWKIKDPVKNGGRTSNKTVLFFIIILIGMIVLFASGTFKEIFNPVLERLSNEGLDSMGRDVELEFGLDLFRNNKIFGGGWGTFFLQDLNGSIVVYNNHSAYIALLARGGLFMAVPTFLSFYMLLKNAYTIRSKSRVALVLMLVFLSLSYGNAGLFNYTICSLIPPVVLDIKKEMSYEDK